MRVVLSCSRISPEDEVLPNTFDFCNSTKLSGAWRGGLLGTFGDVAGVLALMSLKLPDIACKINFAVLVTF